MTILRPIPLLVAMLLLMPALLVTARADPAAEIIQTHPQEDAGLALEETFYVLIAYRSDEPISLWARPFLNGEEVPAMSNPSARHVGEGEAMGWFALAEPGNVDEVRIQAGGGTPYREWELARHPVDLRWFSSRSASPPAAPAPAWVGELEAADEARMREDVERRASEPLTTGEAIFFNGFMLAVLALCIAGLGVPLWCAWKWQGGWKVAAFVPVALLGFVVLRIVVGTAIDPTSHNLWPFEILTFGAVGLAIIGVLKVARRFMGVEAEA